MPIILKEILKRLEKETQSDSFKKYFLNSIDTSDEADIRFLYTMPSIKQKMTSKMKENGTIFQ